MKKNRRIFVTYADAAYAGSKRRILREAESTGEFDSVIGAGPEDVSVEVRSAPAFTKRRGTFGFVPTLYHFDLLCTMAGGIANGILI